jgi:mannosyltransferase
MIGSRYASEFKKKIVSMDLVDDVEFSGYLNNDLLEQRYQTADALLVASTVEGFSIPALEALNRGIPLISTPLPSVREFAGEAAWWSADFNAESLRDAFFEMSESQSEKMRRVMEGRLLAKRFTPVSQARQTCAVYQEALNEKAQLDRDKNRSDRSAKLLWRSVLAQKQAAAGGRL